MIRRSLLLKIGLLCLLPAAALATDAVDLFQRSQASDKTVSYRGMKAVTLRCDKGLTKALFKVVHLKPDKTRTEYFAPAMLGGMIIIENGSESWRYNPARAVWKQLTNPRPQLHDLLSQEALENFEMRYVGLDNLAGRPVYEICAVPKSRGEGCRRLWIDRDHYVVIGTQVETATGAVLNRSEFTKIEFNPPDISPQIFKVDGKVEESAKPIDGAPFKALKPTYVPSGYKLVGIAALMVQRCQSVHLQYSNGASTISIFERKSDCPLVGRHAGGTVLNVFTCTRSGMQFTLIGSVPRSELRKMADSLR